MFKYLSGCYIVFDADEPPPASVSTTTDTPAPETTEAGKSFSQAELDKIAGTARKEGRQTAVNELLKELGLEKADDLKTLVSDYRAKTDAEKTELERLEGANADLQNKIKALETMATEREKQAQVERLKTALTTELHGLHINADKVRDALVLLEADGKLADCLNDDGTIKADAVKKVATEYKTTRTEHFQGATPGTLSNSDATGKLSDPEAKAKAEAFYKRLHRGI